MALAWLVGMAAAAAPLLMLPIKWAGFIAAGLLLIVGVPCTVLLRCWHRADYDLFVAAAEKVGLRAPAFVSAIRFTRDRFAADGGAHLDD